MKKIDFSLIFNIADDGIYYDGGKLSFSDLKKDKDGFLGRRNLPRRRDKNYISLNFRRDCFSHFSL